MTLAEARAELARWQAALEAILDGAQEYAIGSRRLVRADLAEVVKQRDAWQRRVDQLAAGRSGVRVMRVVPRDL